jgi:hypothetical protein
LAAIPMSLKLSEGGGLERGGGGGGGFVKGVVVGGLKKYTEGLGKHLRP